MNGPPDHRRCGGSPVAERGAFLRVWLPCAPQSHHNVTLGMSYQGDAWRGLQETQENHPTNHHFFTLLGFDDDPMCEIVFLSLATLFIMACFSLKSEHD